MKQMDPSKISDYAKIGVPPPGPLQGQGDQKAEQKIYKVKLARG